MFEKICEIINEKMDIDVSEISKDSTFESLDIDSLDMVEIIMDLEEAFDVELEDAQDLKTISDLMDFIENDERAEAYRGLDWSQEYEFALHGDPNDTPSAL